MDLLDAICGRRAVRRYKRACPCDDLLRQLIDAAIWAPSAMNGQVWRFTVITDAVLIETISTRAKAWILENEPWLLETEQMRSDLRDPQFHLFHHAPVLIVIAAPSDDKWTAEGCAAAAQNLMLAATGLGLGSCWVGLAQEWLNTSQGRKAIGLAAGERVIAPIVVGYADETLAPVTRKAPAICWIRDGTKMVEDGEGGGRVTGHGLYGALVHP